jgi:tetratricopeptide (TPR) repeat protein
MPGNEQELLKLETEIYHSDGGIYFADCDTASTRDGIAQQLENRFINKNIKIIKVNLGVGEIASTREEIARHLENVSLSKDTRRSEIGIRANDLAYTLNRYHGDDAVFFVHLPSEKPELKELARILNYTREEFARIKQPIIIWADKVSLEIIARSAPDFWAWRARVSEFRSVSDGLGYGGEVEAAETIWREKISDEEIQSYERALAEFQERGDEKEAANVLGQLGILYYRRGEWDLAIEYYEKDMEIFEALGDRHGLAQTYGNLGLVYARKGEWDLAIEYYEKSMKIKEALGDRHGLAQTYGNLGLVYADKGEWDLAIEYYKKDMEISEALGDRHGVGITLSNIGKGYLDRSNPVEAKRNLEVATKNIHPDARPAYPNALNWLAVSLRMIADQKKREAKLASSDVEREKLVSGAAELYREAGENYKETYNLPLARMPRSLMMDMHLSRALSYSVQNITEKDVGKAIELLDSAIAEMEAALEFADGADVIRLGGAIASHRAKRCVREIGLYREDVEKRDELLDEAIFYLGEASGSFESLGETDACSSKTCDGCRHLYTALGLIRDGYREESNQKIMDAVSEIRLADECYQSISNELGTDVVDRVNEILRRVAGNLKNVEGFDPSGAVDAANNVFDALDEIAGVGLRNMIKILVFDEAGNVTERKAPKYEPQIEPPPEKPKSTLLWGRIFGSIGGIASEAIAIILIHFLFEESIKRFATESLLILIMLLSITIFIRHKISKSET